MPQADTIAQFRAAGMGVEPNAEVARALGVSRQRVHQVAKACGLVSTKAMSRLGRQKARARRLAARDAELLSQIKWALKRHGTLAIAAASLDMTPRRIKLIARRRGLALPAGRASG